MAHTEENAFLRNYTTSLNKPVYKTLEGFISQLSNPYSKEIKVLEKEAFDGSMLILIEKRQLRISQLISNNLYIKTQ